MERPENSWKAALSVIFIFISTASGSKHERTLLNNLLLGYSTLERPVGKHENAVDVSFGVTLMQILNVDPKTETLETNLWITMEWNDYNLRWDPQQYGNISSLRIPPSRIWKPDILAYNSADKAFDTTFETNAVVKSGGSITYITPGIFTTTCKMDLRWFPFDQQKCSIKFGSWTWDGSGLNLTLNSNEGADVGSYIRNQEWDLIGMPSTRDVIHYACCPEPYISVTFTANIRRRGETYSSQARAHNALIFVILLLSLLAPPTSNHKITLGITSFVMSIWTFLVLQVPAPTILESRFVMYFGFLILLTCIGLVLNVFTIYLFHKMAPMPDWARAVALEKLPASPLQFICPVGKLSKSKGKKLLVDSENAENPNQQKQTAEGENHNVNEWIILASILDRCFFLAFSIVLAIVYAAWYPSMEKFTA